jgi:hypothetical protein
MSKPDIKQFVIYYLPRIVAVDVAIFIVTGLVCWFVGWRTFQQYGTGLVIASVVIVLLGSLSLLGGYSARGDFDYQYGRSAGRSSIPERNRLDIADTFASFRFLIGASLVAVLPAIIGMGLRSLK